MFSINFCLGYVYETCGKTYAKFNIKCTLISYIKKNFYTFYGDNRKEITSTIAKA